MESRPLGILIIAIMFLLGALLTLLTGISIIFPGTPLDMLSKLNTTFPPSFSYTGYFLFIIGLILLSAGWGLLKGHKWAWWITIIIFVVGGIAAVVRVALGSINGIGGIVGVLIIAGFLYYLTRHRVLKFFEK